MSAYVERSWISADGLHLAGRDYAGAHGPARLPLVCLHGLTRNARDFEALAPAVAASGRRVLAFDVRGRGRSDFAPDPQTYALPTYCADVIGWAKALGVGQAVFVGTSMGGMITMALAALAPGLVAAAVLNDIGPEVSAAGLARIAIYASGAPVATWAEAQAYAARVNGPAFPDFGAADWAAFARRIFVERDGRIVLDYDARIAEPLAAAAQAQADAELKAVPSPLWPMFDALALGRRLLLVRGALSDILTPQTCDEMARRAPGMERVDICDVGHAPTLTEPDALAALTRFLDTTP